MTTVSHGMDVERVRQIATQIQGLAGRVDDVRTEGTAQIKALEGAWSGEDVEALTEKWHDMAPTISGAAQRLRQSATEMRRDAEEQERASEGDRGWSPPDFAPFPLTKDKPGVIERLVDGITDVAVAVKQGARDVLDVIGDFMANPLVKFPLLARSIIKELRKYWKEVDTFFKGLPERFPRLARLFSRAEPVLKFLSRFGKVIPGLGVILWAKDVWDIAGDVWNGEINPREIWSTVVLGGVAAFAGCFPGVGSLISLLVTGIQLGYDGQTGIMTWGDRVFGKNNPVWLGVKTGMRVIPVIVNPATGVPGLLPNGPITLPVSPKKVWEKGIEGLKSGEYDFEGRPGGIGLPISHPLGIS